MAEYDVKYHPYQCIGVVMVPGSGTRSFVNYCLNIGLNAVHLDQYGYRADNVYNGAWLFNFERLLMLTSFDDVSSSDKPLIVIGWTTEMAKFCCLPWRIVIFVESSRQFITNVAVSFREQDPTYVRNNTTDDELEVVVDKLMAHQQSALVACQAFLASSDRLAVIRNDDRNVIISFIKDVISDRNISMDYLNIDDLLDSFDEISNNHL